MLKKKVLLKQLLNLQKTSRYLLAICLLVTVVNVFLILLIIWTRKSLKLAIKLMEQANHVLFSNIGVIFSSVIASCLQVNFYNVLLKLLFGVKLL